MELHQLLGIPLGVFVLPMILRSGVKYRWFICFLLLVALFMLALYINFDKWDGIEYVFRSFGSSALPQGICGYLFYKLVWPMIEKEQATNRVREKKPRS